MTNTTDIATFTVTFKIPEDSGADDLVASEVGKGYLESVSEMIFNDNCATGVVVEIDYKENN